ncbi:AntiZyme INhibitor [Caenorhabditis elegans]|uniref:AntiZyme INhibitor n=1 Tax=Caenorhabditis elegans TaxID=6239 RepID=A0A2K5ATM9_CAEEL|nr:Uncharacterized protein CELE_F53F10.2 [Caenorhabditis elegans]SPC47131.2 Uncharacterized protein CELE_F53F10.2 [Caenorhabditis elegans]|eukprot:NP_001348679.2 Uncharacterized protein CELE_F53F10.2 [Caenorhabditis elegans]
MFRALQGRECAWKLARTVPNSSKIPSAEESNESSIPPLSGAVVDQISKIYAEPQLRASQIQLDKNAEPPWDPDPKA